MSDSGLSLSGKAAADSSLYRIAYTTALGTTERELGEILAVSANAAEQREFRARRSVRARLAAARCPIAEDGR